MENNKARNIKDVLDDGLSVFRRAVNWFNQRLSKVYSPNLAAITGTVAVLVMAAVILFFPPVMGVADDGSLSDIMLGTGLGYRAEDLSSPVGSYFTRIYIHSTQQSKGFSTHRLLIQFAKWLDNRFTHDNLFDIRFLAAVYLIAYLPAVYLTLRGIVARVRVAAEATALMIVGALILGDASMIMYFNSLYPEAFWQVFLIYCIGFCLALQHGTEIWTQIGLTGFMLTGAFLILSEQHCAAVGIIFMIFCVRQIFMEDSSKQSKMLAVIGIVVLLMASLVTALIGSSRFTEASRLHTITNGVMMQASNPEKVLEDFDIDPRFETLADVSTFSAYPYAAVGNQDIQRNFLSKVTIWKILLYYMKNPFNFISLLEYGTISAFNPNRRFVGNFEKTTGLPERAQNGILIFYSNFKSNSLPQTMGFLVIMSVVYVVLFRKQKGLTQKSVRWTNRERQIMLDTFFCLLAAGIADIATIIFMSGTAELERYQMLYGICIDGILMLFISEILHRTNILAMEG